jgi:hypothetical protein
VVPVDERPERFDSIVTGAQLLVGLFQAPDRKSVPRTIFYRFGGKFDDRIPFGSLDVQFDGFSNVEIHTGLRLVLSV